MTTQTTDLAVLRRWAAATGRHCLSAVYDGGDELQRELAVAADEIERLRAEIVKLNGMVPAWKLIQAGYPDNFTERT